MDRNLPAGSDHNKRLEPYSAAMAEVAAAQGVVFVELFKPTCAGPEKISSLIPAYQRTVIFFDLN